MDNRPSILVVDDDEAILRLLTDSLSDQYEVKTASDVLEAADLLQAESFDLLILDLNMPVVDGSELLDIFRVQPNFENLPILVISAYQDLIERVRGARINAILPKPFAINTLRQTVADTIRSAQSSTAPSE